MTIPYPAVARIRHILPALVLAVSLSHVTASAQPAETISNSAVYDPARTRMLVFGGANDLSLFSDSTWALSLSDPPTWSLLAVQGATPSPRYVAAAVYDPVRDRMIVVAGVDASGPRNDTWALSLDASPTWSQLQPTGTAP